MRPEETESSPAPSSPPPSRPAVNLSSMVVRPSSASSGDGDLGYNYDDFDRRSSSPTPRRRCFERYISPPSRRLSPNGSRSNYDREFSPLHFSRGYGGGSGRGKFRNMSPPRFNSGFGRTNGGRFHGRGYESDMHLRSPFEDDEFDNRNDPNLSPREGDWICVNPRQRVWWQCFSNRTLNCSLLQ